MVVHKPLVADGVIHKPFVADVDPRSQAVGGIRGSSFTSRWLHTWIVVYRPLVSEKIVQKSLVAVVYRRSQAYGGRGSRFRAFGSRRGSSLTGPSWPK